MKEATGELNMTVVTVVAIIAVLGIFWFMYPFIRNWLVNTFSEVTECVPNPENGWNCS